MKESGWNARDIVLSGDDHGKTLAAFDEKLVALAQA